MFQRIVKFFEGLHNRSIKKEERESIWKYLEIAYEIQKAIYERNCSVKEYASKNRKERNFAVIESENLYFELIFSIPEHSLHQSIGLNIEEIIRDFEREKKEKFLIHKSYEKMNYEISSKHILSGDNVFKYCIYSLVHKKSFRVAKQEDTESEKVMGKEIDFYDYFASS